MSSVEHPCMDDNLITRRKKILQSIEDIRGKKAEIAQALRELGVGNPQENESVKNDMKQLLEAFDAISKQESQYMDILKTIVGIHEQATLDIAKDFEKKIERDAQKLEEAKEKLDDDREKTPEELANSEVMAEIQEALLELKTVSQAAIAASELNDKLTERLQLTKRKKNAQMEIRQKKAKELDEEATRLRAEVMERINKTAALKKTTGKQEKELKELQKQCLELGIQLDGGQNQQLDPAAEQATLDNEQRVPVIADTQQKPELNEEEKERRREEIRENIKKEMEKKEQVNALIREKLASMDARRKRLQEIRKQLEKQDEKKMQSGEGITLTPETPRSSESDPSQAPIAVPESAGDEEPVVEKSLDDILANAKASLASITAMREQLEHIKETGGADLNEKEVADLMEQLDDAGLGSEDEQSVEKSAVDLIISKNDEKPSEDGKNDLEAAIRSSFHSVFQPKPLILAENQRALIVQARKAALEDMIRKIDEKVQ